MNDLDHAMEKQSLRAWHSRILACTVVDVEAVAHLTREFLVSLNEASD